MNARTSPPGEHNVSGQSLEATRGCSRSPPGALTASGALPRMTCESRGPRHFDRVADAKSANKRRQMFTKVTTNRAASVGSGADPQAQPPVALLDGNRSDEGAFQLSPPGPVMCEGLPACVDGELSQRGVPTAAEGVHRLLCSRSVPELLSFRVPWCPEFAHKRARCAPSRGMPSRHRANVGRCRANFGR